MGIIDTVKNVASNVASSVLGNPDLERLEKMTIIPMRKSKTKVTLGGETIEVVEYKKACLLHVQFNPNSMTLDKLCEQTESNDDLKALADETDRVISDLSFKLYYNSADAGPESIGALTDLGLPEGPISLNKEALQEYAVLTDESSPALFSKSLRMAKLLASAVMPDAALHKINPLTMNVSVWANFWEAMADFDPVAHAAWKMYVQWGDFEFRGQVKKVKIDFKRFSQSGVATEMEVDLTLRGERTNPNSLRKPWFSPDTDKIKDVSLDTTIFGLAQEAYDNPAHWRKIAIANDIDNPRHLMLGDKLRLPAMPGG